MKRILITLLFVILLSTPLVASAEELNTEQSDVQEIKTPEPFIIVIFYAMALMWKTNTTDGLMYLIPAVGTLASVTIGFYYWKAKMENMVKLSKENDMSIDEIKSVQVDMDNYDIN